jgi:hypothetical protein
MRETEKEECEAEGTLNQKSRGCRVAESQEDRPLSRTGQFVDLTTEW